MGDYTLPPTPPADPTLTASVSAVPNVTVSNPPADSTTLDPNRPVSIILADSPQATTSAQPEPTDLSAVASAKVDPVDQVFEATASAEIIPPADSQPAVPISPQFPESPQSSDTPAPTASPVPTEPQSSPVSTPLEALKENSIQDHPPSNQPSQVQPEAPRDIPVVQVENVPNQSAGIKPEPTQGTQNTPSADIKLPESPKSSFGDLIANPSDLSEEPAIHIDPIEAPKSTSEKPIPTPSIPSTPSDTSIASNLSGEASDERRQHANEVRKQKKNENLEKIVTFVQTKGTATNLDIRDFLHISQSTTTDYLRTLVNSGKLKKEGKAKATTYSL